MGTAGTAKEVARMFRSGESETSDLIGQIVNGAKEHLGADVSFLSEFVGGQKTIMRTEGDGATVGLVDGCSFPLEDTYCNRVVNGALPSVIADARNDARVNALPITAQLKIGAYVGVPVTLPDGRVFGTLCCVFHEAETSLTNRDANFMRMFADLIGSHLHREDARKEDGRLKTERIRSLLEGRGLKVVFQPIVDLTTGAIVGAEALSRFEAEPRRSPDIWFKEASEVGLGTELEILAVRSAIAHLREFSTDAYLSVNASPATFVSEALKECVADASPDRLVIELTEHAVVEDYQLLQEAIKSMRKMGVRIAMDDVGAGYSGLTQILRVAPSIVKLDRSLTVGVNRDTVRQALISASVGFSARVRSTLVAEGLETAEEAETVRALGVRYGQGYYFARPGPLPLQVQARSS